LLTPEVATERFLARAAEIEEAIIAESVRWGDSKRAQPYTKADWQNEIDRIVNQYFPQRTDILLNQLRNTRLRSGASAPLYPAVSPPSFNQHGGQVATGFELLMSGADGVIYYTLDGSDPRLPGGAISPTALVFESNTTSETLVAAGSQWRYLDDGSDQGAAWRDPGFDDSAWKAGGAQLGYGDGGESTLVDFGGDAGDKHITTYFRREFDATDVADVSELTLRLLRDDGAVVYLNGQEVARSNMPGGAVGSATRAASGWAGRKSQRAKAKRSAGGSLLSAAADGDSNSGKISNVSGCTRSPACRKFPRRCT